MTSEQNVESGKKSEQVLLPFKELVTPDGYRWFVYSKEDTGMPLLCLEHVETGIIVTTPIVDAEYRSAAFKAWAGARHSRAKGLPWEIMHEMVDKNVDPDQKLREMALGYGHASVGDMASLTADIVGIPMHVAYALFASSAINSGQEKSTRYQGAFKNKLLHPLRFYLPDNLYPVSVLEADYEYQALGKNAIERYTEHRSVLTKEFVRFFEPSDQKEKDSLDSRVLDCVRYFLLFGQNSGLSFETSARDWSRIISEFKASPLAINRQLGSQIEKLFSPSFEEEQYLEIKAEAPSLIRHTDANPLVNANLLKLKEFLLTQTNLLQAVRLNKTFNGQVNQEVQLISGEFSGADKLVAQYLLLIFPGLEVKTLLAWVKSRSESTKATISSVIFNGHDNYRELPVWAKTTELSLFLTTYLGELRDFDRHRSCGRSITLPLVQGLPIDYDTAVQLVSSGYGLPLYLTKIPEFSSLAANFSSDLANYYFQLGKFLNKMNRSFGDNIDYSFVINLLPLAHQFNLFLHGDPKSFSYLTAQRSRNGGHINYRDLAFRANQLIADSDTYYSGMRLKNKPDPRSRVEFFDRS